MSKRTFTKSLRHFDLGKSSDGGPALVPRETIREAAKPVKKIVKCGLFEVEVFVSEGQIINEYKVCKRFLKEKAKEDRKNYGK